MENSNYLFFFCLCGSKISVAKTVELNKADNSIQRHWPTRIMLNVWQHGVDKYTNIDRYPDVTQDKQTHVASLKMNV